MQIDFHFYTIYALARCAGFEPKDAHVVAYASQHTDDAKYEHALEFENGGRFQQVLSAHKYLDKDTFGKPVCYRIWVPFHFLPGNSGVEFYDQMITRANSPVAQKVIGNLLESAPKPFTLHRLGVTLHVFADTWSHQGFIGLVHDKNDVDGLDVKDEDESSIASIFGEIKESFLEYTFPRLGHAQAGHFPDEPFREWTYKDFRGKRLDIVNRERTMDAAQNCYMVMLLFLRRFPEYSKGEAMNWNDIAETFGRLFGLEKSAEDREKEWREAISSSEFGFKAVGRDKGVTYDDREWFRAAVKVKKDEEGERYERFDGFETSDWKHFHDAAAYHRFIVLHEILPWHGMICG